jgi:hypothetical protein
MGKQSSGKVNAQNKQKLYPIVVNLYFLVHLSFGSDALGLNHWAWKR